MSRTSASRKAKPNAKPGSGIAYGPDGISTSWEFVTPEMAAEYLKRNVNRKLKNGVVDRLGYAMENGLWVPTHQGMGIDVNGDMTDAQHRMHAIVKSGVGQWMLITRNLSVASRMVIDSNTIRSMFDRLTLDEVDMDDRIVIPVVKMMMSNPDSDTVSNNPNPTEFKEAVILWGDAISATNPLWKKKRFKKTSVLAPIAKAILCGHREKMECLIRVMVSGNHTGKQEDIAFWLRDKIENTFEPVGQKMMKEQYRRMQNGIRMFLDEEEKQDLRQASGDLFPIPAKYRPEWLKAFDKTKEPMPKTQAAKRNRVSELLLESPWLSDREISRRTETTHPFVSGLRKELAQSRA